MTKATPKPIKNELKDKERHIHQITAALASGILSGLASKNGSIPDAKTIEDTFLRCWDVTERLHLEPEL